MHTYANIADPKHRRRLTLVALELRAVPTPSLTPRQKNRLVRSFLRSHGQVLQELSHLWGGR